jgi:6-pyruvoyltetrahydropterin/6-carboxytetrahydropterin synthase
MFEITTEASFSAAHHLRDYKGPCENVHGHNWQVRVTVRCEQLDAIGIGIDFRTLKGALRTVLEELDHVDLNTIFSTAQLNPSSENIARYLFNKMAQQVNDGNCRMYRVEVYETPGNSAAYLEE